LLHLVFQVGEVGFNRFQPLPRFVVHKFGRDFNGNAEKEQET
jgi:hypothetical protein